MLSKTAIAGVILQAIALHNHPLGGALLFVLLLALPCHAQEIEPRRWSHLPIGSNFVGGGYSYTEAEIYFDPVLQIENATMAMHTWGVSYIHAFELVHKSALIEFTQGLQEGEWSGLLAGTPASVRRRGLSDTRLRLAVNLHGAPPLAGEAFAAYRARTEEETIIGTALIVHLPTGEYLRDKLINLGANRYTFRPQVGVVHSRGRWSAEATGSVWLYTANNDFYGANTLEENPLCTLQAHLVYTFYPGLWASGSLGYAYGGRSTVNGREMNDVKENLGWALSLGLPLSRTWGVKIAYLGNRTQRAIGQDADRIAASLMVMW